MMVVLPSTSAQAQLPVYFLTFTSLKPKWKLMACIKYLRSLNVSRQSISTSTKLLAINLANESCS